MTASVQGSLDLSLSRKDWLIPVVGRYLYSEHKGHRNAITIQSLADKFGVDRRTMAGIIEMLPKRGWLIGTSCKTPMGVFAIDDDEDRRLAIENLKPRALKIFVRLGKLDKQALEDVYGQAKMELMV